MGFIRTLLFFVCITITLLYLLFTFNSDHVPYRLPHLSWITSTHKGWHSRALDHDCFWATNAPHSFKPTKEALVFAVLENRPDVDPDGLVLAVFEPRVAHEHNDGSDGEGFEAIESRPVAVDAMGRIMYLTQDTFEHLTTIAQRVSFELPRARTFRNTWRIKHPSGATSQPIYRLLFKTSLTSDPKAGRSLESKTRIKFRETSIQGFDLIGSTLRNMELAKNVGKFSHLPELMKQFFGLAIEAREDYVREDVDKDVVDGVMAVIGLHA